MQPSSSAAATRSLVQTENGKTLPLAEVKSIKLGGSWHPISDCQITYRAQGGRQEQVAFDQVEGFSDENQPR